MKKILLLFLLAGIAFSCSSDVETLEDTKLVQTIENSQSRLSATECEGLTGDGTMLVVTTSADGQTGRACETEYGVTNCWDLGTPAQIIAQCQRLLPQKSVEEMYSLLRNQSQLPEINNQKEWEKYSLSMIESHIDEIETQLFSEFGVINYTIGFDDNLNRHVIYTESHESRGNCNPSHTNPCTGHVNSCHKRCFPFNIGGEVCVDLCCPVANEQCNPQ